MANAWQGDGGRPDDLADRAIIRDLVQNWVIFRDAGLWDQFRTVWHADGRMQATWTEGGYEDFIAASQAGWEKGLNILHALGGTSIELVGNRAIAQSKMHISQRAVVEGVRCDVLCFARSYDFFEKRDGRWGIVFREPIYEKDRLDLVDPNDSIVLDRALLDSFPEGYRHLAYLQTRIGYEVRRDLPGVKGPATDALYARGAAWLRGEPA